MSTQAPIDSTSVLNAIAGVAKKHRPVDEIQRDLDAAKAKHRELHPLVEAEGKKEAKQSERIAKAQIKWKAENPDDPFEPDSFSPPMRPYKADPKLCKAFHEFHYTIADFEKELELAQKARAAGVK